MIRESTIIRRLSKHRPVNAQEVLNLCELPLQLIGSGAYRDAYHIVGNDLVIKIPRHVPKKIHRESNRQHAEDEFTIWRDMKESKEEKYKPFKSYLPDLIYFDSTTGVIIIRKYDRPRYGRLTNLFIKAMEKAITETLNTEEADIHYGNLGVDKNGNYKIIDMGLFLSGGA